MAADLRVYIHTGLQLNQMQVARWNISRSVQNRSSETYLAIIRGDHVIDGESKEMLIVLSLHKLLEVE